MAHCPSAALLRLPHHGRTRNLVCAADDRLRIFALAQAPLPITLGFVGAAAQLSPALHCTSEGYSNTVSASNGLFTLLGFMGLYALLALLFTVLIYREISSGPEPKANEAQVVHAE